MTDIGILGADGRMGCAVIKALLAYSSASPAKPRLTTALTAPGSPNLGKDAGVLARGAELGLKISDDIKGGLDSCDVMIDFSRPQAAIDCVLAMSGRRCRAFVTGTTGYTEIEAKALSEAGREIVLLQSGNFSLGVNLLEALVEQAARALGADWDIEITEQHHKHKIDAPSGTALMLGAAAAKGRGAALGSVRAPMREGVDAARKDGDIGFSAIRGGDIIGVHDVHFISELEQITLGHRAFDRSVFAAGAVNAALWAAKQSPGTYNMRDVLGL
jgi:4-hydroxy-tetrahydrodipicolinate reductase